MLREANFGNRIGRHGNKLDWTKPSPVKRSYRNVGIPQIPDDDNRTLSTKSLSSTMRAGRGSV